MTTNAYNRIKTYMDALSFIDDSDDEESYYSIYKLSQLTALPISVVRRDIYTLFTTTNSIIFNDVNNIDDYDVKQMIYSGQWDDKQIYAPYYNRSYEIPLTKEESFALKQFETSFNSNTISFPIHILNNVDIFPNDVINHILKINDSFTFSCAIEFTYSSPKAGTFKKKLVPEKLVYDSFENAYYLLTVENNRIYPYRLDRIISPIKECDLPFNYIKPHDSIFNIVPNVWGMSFQDEPIRVKVKFYNEANVFVKVRRDLECRTNGRLYEEDGFLYYEDIVYGVSSFKNWLFRYGSSAIVIEPISLRKQIIDSYKKRLEMYCSSSI